MNRKLKNKRQKGQAIVEYVIIVVVVALAGLVVLGAFSDRIRSMMTGVTKTLGDDQADMGDSSLKKMQDLSKDGESFN